MDDVDGSACRFADCHCALSCYFLGHYRPAFSEMLTMQRAAPFRHHSLLSCGDDAGVLAVQHREKTGRACCADEFHEAGSILVECRPNNENLQSKAAVGDNRHIRRT